MLHIHSTQTDKLNNGTLYAPRYEEACLPKGKNRPRSLRSLDLASLQNQNIGWGSTMLSTLLHTLSGKKKGRH